MILTAHEQDAAIRYRAYGLVLSSNAPLSELEKVQVDYFPEHPDLQIFFTPDNDPIPTSSSWYLTVSLADGTPWLRCAKIVQGYLLHFPNLASFIFTPLDNSIHCIPHRHTPSHTVNHLLLDQVLPLVLNYRGKEVLHGAAIDTPYGACAFVGPTGSGKSTLAASFLAVGFSVLTDDCVVLDTCADDIAVIPAYPGLRLWDDAIAALFGTSGAHAPVAHYTPKQRFTQAISDRPICSSAISLAGIYVLETAGAEHASSTSALEKPLLTKREALVTLLSLAFKLDIGDQCMLIREFNFLHRLVTHVPVRRLIVPDSFPTLSDVRAGILHDLAEPC